MLAEMDLDGVLLPRHILQRVVVDSERPPSRLTRRVPGSTDLGSSEAKIRSVRRFCESQKRVIHLVKEREDTETGGTLKQLGEHGGLGEEIVGHGGWRAGRQVRRYVHFLSGQIYHDGSA